MNEKKWYMSKTIWGGLLAVAAGLAGLFGYTVTIEQQTELSGLLVSLGSTIGGIASIIGRVKAKDKVTK